jgi:hypothetical protein
MSKKALTTAMAAVMVLAVAFIAFAGSGESGTCDKTAKATTAKATHSGCCAAATTASACTRSASAAKVASSACTRTAGSTACTKTSKASAAKVAAGGECCPHGAAARYERAGNASCCAKARAAHTAELKKTVDQLPYRENRKVVMSGKLLCGKCDLGAFAECQPLLKTAEGKIYPLAHGLQVKAMRKTGADSYEVSSQIKKIDGVKFLDVRAFKAL